MSVPDDCRSIGGPLTSCFFAPFCEELIDHIAPLCEPLILRLHARHTGIAAELMRAYLGRAGNDGRAGALTDKIARAACETLL
jgi:hypothetical protein